MSKCSLLWEQEVSVWVVIILCSSSPWTNLIRWIKNVIHFESESHGIWPTDVFDYNCSLRLFCYSILVAVVTANAMVVSVVKESGYGWVRRCFTARKEKSRYMQRNDHIGVRWTVNILSNLTGVLGHSTVALETCCRNWCLLMPSSSVHFFQSSDSPVVYFKKQFV